jgi:hypothetical protein
MQRSAPRGTFMHGISAVATSEPYDFAALFGTPRRG